MKLPVSLGIATTIIWWIVLIPIAVYNGYSYYKYRHHIIMQKRYANITIYEVIIMVIKLIWGILLFFMVIYFGEGSVHASIFDIPYQLLSFMLLYFWVWRFWLIHYDINLTLCTVKQDWAIIINKRYKDLKVNWYINNKAKYGNYHWFKNHCIIPLITIQTLIIVAPIIYFGFIDNTTKDKTWHDLQLFSSINLLFPFILLLLIYLRTPYFNDQFFVSIELKKIFIILLIKNILTFIIFLYQTIENPDQDIDEICFFLFLNISNIGQWYAIYIATHYVNKKVSPIIKKQQYKIMDYHTMSKRKNTTESIPYLRITGDTPTTDEHISTPIGASPVEDIKLLHVIQHMKGFETFITHLSYEFCSECLLSFVEMLQFQQHILMYMKHKNINIENINGGKSLFERIKLPNELPKSSIVYDGMDADVIINVEEHEFINMMKIKGYKLYKKYVAVGIQYQVNISYNTRRKIEKFITSYDQFILNENITLNDLLFLFDKCNEEIYSLMNDSFNRFSNTSEFRQLMKLYLFNNNI